MTMPSYYPEQSHTSLPQVSNGLPYAIVVWRDAYTNILDEIEFSDPTYFGKTVICWDIGFIIRESKKEIVLSVGACPEDNTVRHSNTIPRSMIIAVHRLGTFKWAPPIQKKTSRTRKKTNSTDGSTNTSTLSMPNTSPSSTIPPPTEPSP